MLPVPQLQRLVSHQSRTALSPVACKRLLRILMIVLFAIVATTVPSALANGRVVQSSQHRSALDRQEAVDAVMVLDNVSHIASHDTRDDRFSSAALFADLALPQDRVGTIEISSSKNVTGNGYYDLNYMTRANKKAIKQVFAGDAQRGLDPDPTAYFSSALQAAQDMLMKAPNPGGPPRQRYVIVVTDTLAQSGDTDNCPGTDVHHTWYCHVAKMSAQGIGMILLAFASADDPQSQQEFMPTLNYISSHGGQARVVESGDNLVQNLAQQYTTIFSSIHANVFQATLDGGAGTFTIDNQIGNNLNSVTVVALGQDGVSLSGLVAPGNRSVARKQDPPESYYFVPGKIYWLETVSVGRLAGSWRLEAGAVPPSKVLIITVSQIHLDLLDPGPSLQQSIVSDRYVPAGKIILHASLSDITGNPLTQHPLLQVIAPCCTIFGTSDIPPLFGSAQQDSSALLDLSQSPANQKIPILIGLSQPIAQNVYLAKTFNLYIQPALKSVDVHWQTPENHPGQGIILPVNAQGANSPLISSATLGVFERESGAAGRWQTLANNATPEDLLTQYKLEHGCHFLYQFAALEQVNGMLGGAEYHYYSYAVHTYQSELPPSLSVDAAFLSSHKLAWWATTDATWRIQISSALCDRDKLSIMFHPTLKGPGTSHMQVTLQPSPGSSYQLAPDGSNTLTILASANNLRQPPILIDAKVGGCRPLAFDTFAQPDTSITLQLTDATTHERLPSLALNDAWQQNMFCPSLYTVAGPPGILAGIIAFLFSLRFLVWRTTTHLRRPYLKGAIHSMVNVPDLSMPGTALPPVTPAVMNEGIRRTDWYLNYVPSKDASMDGHYTFSEQSSDFSRLYFRLKTDKQSGIMHVVMSAARNKQGVKPLLVEENSILREDEEYPCIGHVTVQIGHDQIIPYIDIGP